MGTVLEDGANGTANKVGVTSGFRLQTAAVCQSEQHHASRNSGQAYQVQGNVALTAATKVALHIKNTSSTRKLIVTYIRMQVLDPAGGTALPDSGNYMLLNFDQTLTSGGTTVTAVNMNRSSGNSADTTCTDNNPTLGGTAVEFDRWYLTATNSEMMKYNKEGTLILGQNDTLTIAAVTDQTSGECQVRVSFYMEV